MNQISRLPQPDSSGFALGDLSLFDALELIERDQSISPGKRNQWRCSLKRVPVFLGRDPRSLPANLFALRFGLKELHEANLGITKKSLQNHISNLRAAIRHVRKAGGLPRSGTPLLQVWEELYEVLPSIRLKRGLSGFVRFCSANGIAPEEVSDALVDRFIDYRMEAGFSKKPRDLRKQTAQRWNEAAKSVSRWPKHVLTVPDYRKQYRRRLEDFPTPFVEDVENYLAWIGGAVLLDRPEMERPNKPSTIATRRREIVGAANAAVESGYALDEIDSLAALMEPACVRKVLEVYLARNGGEPKGFTIDLAGKLVSIARHWCRFPDDSLDELRDFATRLGKYRKNGLTPKNLQVVRQVRQPDVWKRIFNVPQVLMAFARREHNTAPVKAAVSAQLAAAIMILIVAPMRIGNLVGLKISENLSRPSGPGGPIHIVIPDYDVKNGIDLEFPLPVQVARLIDEYLFQYRSRLTGPDNDYLFPSRKDGHKDQRTLSAQITDRVWKHAGIRMTPHQFRHAAAAIILDNDPGNYELVRRVLGHKNIQTTINFYTGLESIDAAKHFAELVLEKGGMAS